MTYRALVVTVVHHPLDARIWHREIAALLERGWSVTYAAPWAGYEVEEPTDIPNLETVDLPRAQGRRRLAAQQAARRLLRQRGGSHDVVLLHDPELLLAVTGLRLSNVVWDVHEDPAAAVEVKTWIPAALRRPTAGALRLAERWAEDNVSLLLADEHYAGRFAHEHPVVPNTTVVPESPLPAGTPDEDGHLRVVYLGSVTMERGAADMTQVGRRLREETRGRVQLEIIGPAHGEAAEVLRLAADAGDIEWLGFMPNRDALPRVEGALAGLSLLHDQANFRPSMPTKVVEYMARAVPVITTPLPLPANLVAASDSGVVVPYQEPERVVRQVLEWAADPAQAAAIGLRGHITARKQLDWAQHAQGFVDSLTRIALES